MSMIPGAEAGDCKQDILHHRPIKRGEDRTQGEREREREMRFVDRCTN